jgi:hypothetical protein
MTRPILHKDKKAQLPKVLRVATLRRVAFFLLALVGTGRILKTLLYIYLRKAQTPVLQLKPQTQPVTVFYNLYTANATEIPRVAALVREQLQPLKHHKSRFSPLIVNSIGAIESFDQLEFFQPNADNNPDVDFAHHQEGSEVRSLQHLWEFCRLHNNPDQLVTYLHAKGSFHPSEYNDHMRRYITVGALSKECTSLPDQCNVCSSRMSPLPHPHTSGNMWTAKCDYIAKLYKPEQFEQQMDSLPRHPPVHPSAIGQGRFASEHWVYSHPDVLPCDVDGSSSYTWNYYDVPQHFTPELRPAPRFRFRRYLSPDMPNQHGQREERINEYKHLYNIDTPPQTWYGWRLFRGMRPSQAYLRPAQRLPKFWKWLHRTFYS